MKRSRTMTLAEKIKNLIAERGWTQTRLAQASGLDPSVLSRLLAGDRTWRAEHVACVAAALGMSPASLVESTDGPPVEEVHAGDIEFITTLTQAHAALVAENAKLAAETTALRKAVADRDETLRDIKQKLHEALHRVETEKHARDSAERAQRSANDRAERAQRELATARADLLSAETTIDGLSAQLNASQQAHAKAVATANTNYAVAQDLQKQLSKAKGLATVATSVLGIAALIKLADS